MERHQFEPELKKSMEGCCIPLAVYQFLDKRVVTLVLSKGFCELFGFDELSDAYYVMDNDMYRDAHPDDVARIANAAFHFATEGGEYNVVYRTRVHGAYRIIHAMGRHIYTEGGVRLAYIWYTDEGAYSQSGGSYTDIINSAFNQVMREGTIYRKSHYDFLTGLPSMSYFFELADAGSKRLLAYGQEPALLFFDLSGMKFYNQKYGFSEGDKLIQAMAKVLVRTFSNENCCRMGQDHFAVFTAAYGLEETLRSLFEECKTLNEGKSLPVRVGICLDLREGIDVSAACDRAKFACDSSRKSYVSCYRYFNRSMLTEAHNRQYIVDNLDRAIRDGWIKVYYQPIIRAANGQVSNEEALSRWIDPVRGLLSPADFTPILEDSMLIYKLDLFVVEQVLAKMKAQSEAGLYLVPISVNLSRADFDVCDMVEEIRRRVDDSGIGRNKLVIEITESVIGRGYDFMKAQILRFRELGFQVWMDDFGSGYSTLDFLQDLPFDLIKFDMRFMQQFDNTDRSKIILTELTKMALGLGIETIAEGVERAEQVEFLREVGCTKLQGFYYCQPISPEEILARYEKGIQIGFENPRESEYYTAIGGINLYDPSVIASEERESFKHYFDTLPMAIMESKGDTVMVVRCNRTYRSFIQRLFGIKLQDVKHSYSQQQGTPGSGFINAVRQCGKDGLRRLHDEALEGVGTVHSFIRRVAVNPVTGTAAIAVVVLGIQ